MESITKNRQSAETLQAMVDRAYGADQVPVGEGWVGELGARLVQRRLPDPAARRTGRRRSRSRRRPTWR